MGELKAEYSSNKSVCTAPVKETKALLPNKLEYRQMPVMPHHYIRISEDFLLVGVRAKNNCYEWKVIIYSLFDAKV